MAEPIYTTLIFLINTIFDLYAFIVALRLLLVWVYADYYQPLVQFIIKLTQKPLMPFRKLFPLKKNLEIGTLLFLLLWIGIKFVLLNAIAGSIPKLLGVIVFSFAETIKLFLNIFFYAILLQVLLSWIPTYSPMTGLLNQITSPIMRPIRRYIPQIAGFDISPIPALIIITVLQLLIVNYLFILGQRLS